MGGNFPHMVGNLERIVGKVLYEEKFPFIWENGNVYIWFTCSHIQYCSYLASRPISYKLFFIANIFFHVTYNPVSTVPSFTFSLHFNQRINLFFAHFVSDFFYKSVTSCHQSNTPPILCHTLPHCSARNCLKVFHAVLGLQASHTTFSWWISAKGAVTSRDFASKKTCAGLYTRICGA
jgi:hypothetical protein